jgi:hypothetical protein
VADTRNWCRAQSDHILASFNLNFSRERRRFDPDKKTGNFKGGPLSPFILPPYRT